MEEGRATDKRDYGSLYGCDQGRLECLGGDARLCNGPRMAGCVAQHAQARKWHTYMAEKLPVNGLRQADDRCTEDSSATKVGGRRSGVAFVLAALLPDVRKENGTWGGKSAQSVGACLQ